MVSHLYDQTTGGMWYPGLVTQTFMGGSQSSVMTLKFQRVFSTLLKRIWSDLVLGWRMTCLSRVWGSADLEAASFLGRQVQPSRGEWLTLLDASSQCDEQAAVARRRWRRQGDDVQKRAVRAEMKVALGELSSARQALKGEEVAPGTRETLRMLTDESKRPRQLRDPIPPEIMGHIPQVPFVHVFEKRQIGEERSSWRTFWVPSGMTVEHLRPILNSVRDQQLFFKLQRTWPGPTSHPQSSRSSGWAG